MNEYQDLVKKLAQINEGASIVTLDVNASSNPEQQIKTVLVGITLSSGASVSMTVQAPCFETLLDSLETMFSVQSQIIEQAIDQVNVMASTDEGMDSMGGMDNGMGMQPTGMEPMGDDDYSFALGDGGDEMGDTMDDSMPAFDGNGEPNGVDMDGESDDVVVDPSAMEPEIGDDVETEEGRYSHNYSFRNKGTGLFQSLTGQQRISKGALKAAKRRLGS